MKEIKKFKVLKGFAIFFTVLLILSFGTYLLFNLSATSSFVVNSLEKMGIQGLSVEVVEDKWANFAILTAAIIGILQLIFICAAFKSAKKAMKILKAARPIQTSVYVNNPKETKKLQKQAKHDAKIEHKLMKKQQKQEMKQVKAPVEKPVQAVETKEPETKVVVKVSKSTRIDDILNGLK